MLKSKLFSTTLTLALFTCLSPQTHADFLASWEPKEAQEKIQNQDFIIIDVRSPEEFAGGHLPNAINLPHNAIQGDDPRFTTWKNQNVLLYCRSGRRAAMAEETLSGLGFDHLYHLNGDFIGWEAANMPVEK